MARYNVNKHTYLSVRLLELRRHLNACGTCNAAIKSRAYELLCDASRLLILEVAIRWESNIPGRLAARSENDRLTFPCPDPNAHGPAYAITAEAVQVIAYQDRLL